MAQHEIEVTGGIDSHKDTHTEAAIDTAGRVLGSAQFPALGYRKLLERPHRGAIRAFRQRREGWGLPCSGEAESLGKCQAS